MARSRLQYVKYFAAPAAGIFFLIWAITVLLSKLHGISFHEVAANVKSLPRSRVVLAIVLTWFNYFVQIGYDVFGLKYARQKVPFKKIALTAFVADSLNSNLGLSAIVGSSVKLRFYSSFGIKIVDVLKAIALLTISYWCGFFFLGGMALLHAPPWEASLFALSVPVKTLIATVLAGLPLTLLALVVVRKEPLALGKVRIPLPTPAVAISLFLVACLDWTSVATVFYLLLPPQCGIHWGELLTIYLIAHMVGMASQVPGGIAVLESIIILLISHLCAVPAVTASLLVFRGIFFLMPFSAALLLFFLFEIFSLKKVRLQARSIAGDK